MSAAEQPQDYPYTDEMFASLHATSGVRTSDDEKIKRWEARVGAEAVDRAREKAAGIIARAAGDGSLDRLAGHLSRSSFLSGDDVARILQTERP